MRLWQLGVQRGPRPRFLINYGANEDRLQKAVLSDRSRQLIRGRAVISQAAVLPSGVSAMQVDPDKGYVNIRRQGSWLFRAKCQYSCQ
jgi:hypothetical protein